MINDLLIRTYLVEDKDKLISLMNEFDDYIQALDPLKRTIYQAGAADYFVNRMLEEAQLNDGVVYVGEINGEIVGFVEGHIEKLSEDAKRELIPTKVGRVNELFVTSNYRQGGLGSALMQKIEAHFKSKNCDYFSIQVFAPNITARKFYEKLGFQERGINLGKKI